MLIIRSIVIFGLVLALMGIAPVQVAADHSWSTYHWGRTANPFTLQLGDNVSGDWDGHLATASADWTVSSVLDTTIVTGGTTGRKCRATSGRVEVCNATYGRNGWLGLAQIWVSGGHIVQGVAKMNDTYFNLAKYNNPNEKLHVLCQEVGHTFGLGHQDESGISLDTCMDYFSNTGENATSTVSTHPNAHDYEQLELIYGGHVDASNTFKSAPTGTGARPSDGGPGFRDDGTPVAAHPSRGDVYVTDLGGGRRIVTFITWAR